MFGKSIIVFFHFHERGPTGKKIRGLLLKNGRPRVMNTKCLPSGGTMLIALFILILWTSVNYTAKLSPQPQLRLALGLLK